MCINTKAVPGGSDGGAKHIWVIGDRDDDACYKEALRRVEDIGTSQPQAVSLAAAMFQLSEMQRVEKKHQRKRS